MSEKDEQIAALQQRERNLLEDYHNLEQDLDNAREASAELRVKVTTLDEEVGRLRTANDTQRQRIEALMAEHQGLEERLVQTVYSMGQENDYCTPGMLDFISKVLAITPSEARTLFNTYNSREVTVTITATITGWTETTVTDREARDFLGEIFALDNDGVIEDDLTVVVEGFETDD